MRTVLFWDFDGTLAEAPHIWSNTLYRLLLDTVPDCDVTLADIRRYTACIFPWDSRTKITLRQKMPDGGGAWSVVFS